MYRTIADFTTDWNYEQAMTRKLLDNLTEESLTQAIKPGGRTLGRLAEHIIHTLVEMPGEAGIKVEPAASGTLQERYTETAKNFAAAVAAQWNDAILPDDVPMYGQVWKKGLVLRAIMSHEVHHRAQMTVLMRHAGLKVPGIYGPAEEEWAAMGLPPME